MRHLGTFLYLFPFIALLALSINCCDDSHLPTEKNFHEVYNYSKNGASTIGVLICDYRQFNSIARNTSKWRSFFNTFEGDELFYTDISLPDNRELQYLLAFDTLPAIITISPGGSFDSIKYPSHIHYFSSEQQNSIRYALDVFFSLQDNNPDTTAFKYLSQNSLSKDSFYTHTLISRYYESLDIKDSAIFYNNRALHLYEEFPCPITEQLYVNALNSVGDSLSHIIISPSIISLDVTSEHIDTTFTITAKNFSKRDFIIFDIIPSCSCLTVNFPRIIKPGASGLIELQYKHDGAIESFRHKLWLNTSIPQYNKIISFNILRHENF